MDARHDRPARLAAELSRLGLETEAANELSSLATVRSPLTRRVGVPGLVRWLRRAGLAPREAQEGAAVLVALDGLDAGKPFVQVVRELRHSGLGPAEAECAALEASGIQRSAPLPEGGDDIPAALLVAALGTTAALAVIFLYLLSTI